MLTYYRKILIYLIILYILQVPILLKAFFQTNFILDYYPFFFFLLPAALILIKEVVSGKIKLPYIESYLLVGTLFFAFDNYIVRENSDISYLISLTIIYICFVTLVNYCNTSNKKNEITIYSFVTIILINSVTYLNLLGFIDLHAVIDENGRYMISFIHPNGQSLFSLIGIFLLTVIKQNKLLNIGNIAVLILFVFLVGIILLNGTRGVFLITLVYVFMYFFNFSSHLKSSLSRYTIFFIFFAILVSFLLESNLVVIDRIINGTSLGEARAQQITLNVDNFMKNIFFGTGYYEAGRGYMELERSNFSYTQILASYGIFVFPFYMYFVYAMFGAKSNNFYSFSVMVISFGALMFYNLSILAPLSILSYFSYVEYRYGNK
jgi:hypothetical protein